MTARTLMVQGSSSSVGKSLLTAALCRIYARRGIRIAPFKAQNMSNNAAVCADGSEIGRAQALQALAAGVQPTADMNPVLIKPEADSHSQVLLAGRPWQTLEASRYYEGKDVLWEHVTASLNRLREDNDLVIIEGAGSPVELNLRRSDIVNMSVALYAKSPVILVGDIDRGGVFAQLLGTLWLLDPEERALLGGFVINKFRGDLALFQGGIRMIEERSGIPVLGVIPYLDGLSLPEEDAVSVEATARVDQPAADTEIDIAVIALPRIANFDDFDPLRIEPHVHVRHVDQASRLGHPHAVIIPGTKSTISDLEWLRQVGLADAIVSFARNGGVVTGICGGYQMLGRSIRDPRHVESDRASVDGLGLLPVETEFVQTKATFQATARIVDPGALSGQMVHGYEIHMGETPTARPWLEIASRNGMQVSIKDGCVSQDGRIRGCYLHGLFHNDSFRRAWLGTLGWEGAETSHSARVEESLDRLADVVQGALNMGLLEKMIWGK